MASLVKSLTALRGEINAAFPNRSKASDGWIGDPAHQVRDSDHNPDARGLVHAIDVDKDLNGPVGMGALVDHVHARCVSGAENRLTYIIWNRRIASASRGWVWRAYTGDNPHTEHAHFSASNVPARENSRSSWKVKEVLPVTAPTASENAAAVAGRDVDPTAGTYSLGGALWTTLTRSSLIEPIRDKVDALNVRVEDVDDDLDGLGATLVVILGTLETLTADPAAVGDGHPIVAAVRYAMDNAPAARVKADRLPKD